MLKRIVLDDNGFLRANTLNDMKANDTLKAGDVIAVAETYRFYNIKSATENGAVELGNGLFAVPIDPPVIDKYMLLEGDSTKNGNLTVTKNVTVNETISAKNLILNGWTITITD